MAAPRGRRDRLTKAQRSALMGRVKSTRTQFELNVFRELRKRGLHFQPHSAGAFGKPDIALPRARRAVFLHSDFWHGWRLPTWEAVLPDTFWIEKLRRNRRRDQKVVRTLRRRGWKVLVVWEHQIKRSVHDVLDRIVTFLNSRD
jgi:DNA mismatch endonuclease (patch repair protein)